MRSLCCFQLNTTGKIFGHSITIKLDLFEIESLPTTCPVSLSVIKELLGI
jgi:hypothetical protein